MTERSDAVEEVLRRSMPDKFDVMDAHGTRCAAADGDACAAQLAGPVSEALRSYCVDACTGVSLVTTRGDEVKQWSSPAELRALLGGIDSEDAALLLARANGYVLLCEGAGQTSVRSVDDGFEVLATRVTKSCQLVETTRYRLHVSRAGELRVLDSKVVQRSNGACIGRKPEGLCDAREEPGATELGAFLARCAHLEAASVFAFERMAEELTAHGAPQTLVERASAVTTRAWRRSSSAAASARSTNVRRALQDAVQTLAATCDDERPWHASAGLPPPATARAMVDALRTELWAHAA